MSDTVETPTQTVVKSSAAVPKTVTDENGRVLVFKRHTLLTKMRLLGIIGGDRSNNDVYMGYLLIVTSVVSIDGVPVPAPRTMAEIEQMVTQIGDEGVNAIILSAIPEDEPTPTPA